MWWIGRPAKPLLVFKLQWLDRSDMLNATIQPGGSSEEDSNVA